MTREGVGGLMDVLHGGGTKEYLCMRGFMNETGAIALNSLRESRTIE